MIVVDMLAVDTIVIAMAINIMKTDKIIVQTTLIDMLSTE
jgi:hypothetical protein